MSHAELAFTLQCYIIVIYIFIGLQCMSTPRFIHFLNLFDSIIWMTGIAKYEKGLEIVGINH